MNHSRELAVYLPMDWRQALQAKQQVPMQAQGTALFADISGFTALTDSLTQTMGARRGTEELTHHLDRVYDAFVKQVNRFGGSVIGFSGDAITCWFQDSETPSPQRATACALALQDVMQDFQDIRLTDNRLVSLAIKSACATGTARRFLVGDPDIHLIDTLAGLTVARMAAGEEIAARGDTILDRATLDGAGELVEVLEWFTNPDTGDDFARVKHGMESLSLQAEVSLALDDLDEEQLRPWVLPPIYKRLRDGLGDFLTELRPAVALFVRFLGIDYEDDPHANDKLDTFIRRVQVVLEQYEGVLIQLTIGDKGSYLYAAFGAPLAHEDDPQRAINTALALREITHGLDFIKSVQIGLSRGTMRTGAYGGGTRRTYGVLGDHVNLAARMMSQAGLGQIMADESMYSTTEKFFDWQAGRPLKVKGKPEPVPVAILLGSKRESRQYTQIATYELPMVGRRDEMGLVADKMAAAGDSAGHIVGITAEAGMGKSRLAMEVLALAQSEGWNTLVGECPSYGTNSAFLAWQPIWQRLFGIDPAGEPAQQRMQVEERLRVLDPAFVEKAPLLAPLLELEFPDTNYTFALEQEAQQDARHAFLTDLLGAYCAAHGPTMILVEDIHWIDPQSHELLEVIGGTVADLPILLVVVSRPPSAIMRDPHPVETLSHFTPIHLAELSSAEAEHLIRAKIGGAYERIPTPLVERLRERSGGNPFYIEELINYLRDHEVDLYNQDALDALDLPNSLYSLILSRVDRLEERQKATLKIASIIGRVFPVAWLVGYYPHLGAAAELRAELEIMRALDLTPLDTPEPNLAYLFKHMVIQEVTYQSLPYATRAELHERFGNYLEDSLSHRLDLLAYHFERSNNIEKKQHYLRLAGEQAFARGAYQAAIVFLEKALVDNHSFGTSTEAAMEQQIGEAYWYSGEGERGTAHIERALALLGQERDRDYEMLGLSSQASNLCQLLEQRHVPPDNTPWNNLSRGIYSVGRASWVTAQTFLEAAGNDPEARIASASAFYYHGEYPAALAIYQKLLEDEHLSRPQRALVNAGLGFALLRSGDDPSEIVTPDAQTPLGLGLRLQWGLLQDVFYEDAAEHLAELLLTAPIANYHLLEGYIALQEFYQRAWTDSGDSAYRSAARSILKKMHQYAQIYDIGRIAVWTYQGRFYWLDGKPERAKRAFGDGLNEIELIQLPYHAALMYFYRAKQLPNEDAERERWLQTALRGFRHIGAGRDIARVQALLDA